ncbi:hypothetical protein SAMN05216412_11366 [Nitrosospira multiformis]|uniref:Uncharacterized protein n=1 Tax=Nitrosospira multiformis TaxID=1231 RepID=A0A1I0GHF8_9PROT|nr:hypothetical protein [Nitrosospira multiformis]SET70591.1 hypothetical protein SAMN05216412_11366 [Nitrosospira multiformis]
MKLSDGEIIENYLLPARRFVEGTTEKRKGRDWLENSAATNTRQPQVKATKEKSSALVDRSGLYLAGLSRARSSKGRIYTDTDLVKYRKENPFNLNIHFSRSAAPAANVAKVANDDPTLAGLATLALATPSRSGG